MCSDIFGSLQQSNIGNVKSYVVSEKKFSFFDVAINEAILKTAAIRLNPSLLHRRLLNPSCLFREDLSGGSAY
ncbi:hypothetical protein VNO77_27547 [Canavalia gladiata]|uniref:Uncharacterized protein n=1 Tax=Canavalia gladiata TaxID=3824 RepID=A0AAN9Q6L2_CANGL